MCVCKHKAELTHSAAVISKKSEIKADEWINLRIFSLILILSLAFAILERYAA